MTKVVQLARFTVKPERSDEFGERLRGLVDSTRQEAGCLRYELYRDDAGRWTMLETWADEAAVDSHMQEPAVIALLEVIGDFLSEPPVVERLEPIA